MEDTKPTIVVVGPGALGCLFAAFFAERNIPTALLDKSSDRAEIISKEGIIVHDRFGSRRVPIVCTADPAKLERPAIICLCVKAFDTEAAMRHLQPLLCSKTLVVSLQNGLGNVEICSHLAPNNPILCAATSQASTLQGTGRVCHAGAGSTIVAPFKRATIGHATTFAHMLRQVGFEAEPIENAARVLWTKLAINAAINPVTAIENVPNGAILKRPDLLETAFSAAREAAAVASAASVRLLCEDITHAVEDVCRKTSHNISSMLQDIRKGRRTEIDSISGAIVREGQRLGLPTPVNEKLLHRVLEISVAR